MSIEFPLGEKESAFGTLSDPRIPILVRTLEGFRAQSFLIDTGADLALTPRFLAIRIGLVWDDLPLVGVRGVGGGEQARFGRLPVRIGEVALTLRCLFIDGSSAPFILGRADFLDRFVLTIDQPHRRITLAEAR